MAEADKVLAAIAAERVDDKASVKSNLNLMKIQSIGIIEGKVYIGLPNPDPWCGDSIRGTLKGDRFIIEAANTICA